MSHKRFSGLLKRSKQNTATKEFSFASRMREVGIILILLSFKNITSKSGMIMEQGEKGQAVGRQNDNKEEVWWWGNCKKIQSY